jgi:hypothetical protein
MNHEYLSYYRVVLSHLPSWWWSITDSRISFDDERVGIERIIRIGSIRCRSTLEVAEVVEIILVCIVYCTTCSIVGTDSRESSEYCIARNERTLDIELCARERYQACLSSIIDIARVISTEYTSLCEYR